MKAKAARYMSRLLDDNRDLIEGERFGDGWTVDAEATAGNFSDVLYGLPDDDQKRYFGRKFENPEDAERLLLNELDDFVPLCEDALESERDVD